MMLTNSETLKLIFCGGLFVANGADRDSMKKIALATGGHIRKYGVDISEFDPKTNQVKKWKMTKGFSVWKPLPKEEVINFKGVKERRKLK